MTDQKPRIIIIDDDLASPTFATVDEELRRVLQDLDAPEFSVLWDSAQRAGAAPPPVDLSEADQRYIASQTTFVQAILADGSLEASHPDLFATYIAPTRSAFDSKQQWYSAFRPHEPNYEIVKLSSHPAPDYVVGSLCVVVDLILGPGVEFESATRFIRGVADSCSAQSRELPLFLLISSQTATLRTRHEEFRVESQISASGLRLIEKSSLSANTGSDLVTLYLSQMGDEKQVAACLRNFCLALAKNNEAVPANLIKHIWNLDCDALLRIYRAAREDNDPFDEHLLEFLVRHLSWLLYKERDVREALAPVERALGSRLVTGKPAKRFYSIPGRDRNALRQLIESYHWLPFQEIDLSAISCDELVRDIGRVLPFGALIIGPDPAVGADVLVHVTQPCDLLRIKELEHLPERTLSFIRGTLEKPNPESEVGDNSKNIVPALRLSNNYFTLHVASKHPWSDYADKVWAQLRHDRKRTVARLRHDVARRIVYGYATDIMRPATPRLAHAIPISARVLLRIGNSSLQEFQCAMESENGTGIDGILETFKPERGSKEQHVTLRGDLLYGIALWIKDRLTTANVSDVPSVDAIAMGLRDNVTLKSHQLTNKVQVIAQEVNGTDDPKIEGTPTMNGGCAKIFIPFWIV